MCFKTYGIDATELNIDIINIGLGFSAIITNIGDTTAWEVEWKIHSECKGILRTINITTSGNAPDLEAGASFTVSTGFFLGFGNLTFLLKGFISDVKVQKMIFPIEKNGIINPNMDKFSSLF